MKQRAFALLLISFTACAQNVNLISLSTEESRGLVSAYKASQDAERIARAKYDAYYVLTQKVRGAHHISGCAAFTGDFRWIVSGAYSPLNSASGVLTSDVCYGQ